MSNVPSEDDISITDAAEELHRLWTDLLSVRKDNRPTYAVLADYLGVGSKHNLQLRLQGVMAARLERLAATIKRTKHPLVQQSYRADLMSAIDSMGSLISAANMGRNWKENVQSLHPAEIAVVGTFSHIARSIQPLRALSRSERADFEMRIEETIATLDQDPSIERWMAELLVIALDELLITVRNLRLFGHGAIVDGLIGVRETYRFVEDAVSIRDASRKRTSLLSVANLILFGFNIVAIPPQFEVYLGWYSDQFGSLFQNYQGGSSGSGSPSERIVTALLPKPPEQEEVVDE